MQPSRHNCLFASFALACVFSCALAPRAHADTLTITSTPAGATLEIDGKTVGPTPYKIDYPGGYFHKTHSIFGNRLEHAMTLRVSMDGYLPQQLTMTTGPFEWVAFNGHHHGSYFLLRSDHFNILLDQVPARRESADTSAGVGPIRPYVSMDTSQANFGSVKISSDPSGADIYVDGNFMGQTPSTIQLTAGSYDIHVQSEGKQSWTRTLQIAANSQITLKAVLEGSP